RWRRATTFRTEASIAFGRPSGDATPPDPPQLQPPGVPAEDRALAVHQDIVGRVIQVMTSLWKAALQVTGCDPLNDALGIPGWVELQDLAQGDRVTISDRGILSGPQQSISPGDDPSCRPGGLPVS